MGQTKNANKESFMLGNAREEKKYYLHNRKRYQFIFSELDNILKGKKNAQVLDIGTSPLTFLIKKRYPKVLLSTLDYSDNFKSECEKHGITFIRKDLNKKTSKIRKNAFDIIIFLEVVEHLKLKGRYIISLLRDSLKKDGYLFIQTPNKFSLKNIVLRVISEKIWHNLSCPPSGGEEFDHFKEYGYQEFKSILNGVKGLELVKSERPLYFDDPESTLVYRKNKNIFYPIMYFYFLVVRLIPFFRRAMYFKLKRI